MQGADTEPTAHVNFAIKRPYAGIIRIRFMGMISARNSPDTPAIVISGANIQILLNSQKYHKSRVQQSTGIICDFLRQIKF